LGFEPLQVDVTWAGKVAAASVRLATEDDASMALALLEGLPIPELAPASESEGVSYALAVSRSGLGVVRIEGIPAADKVDYREFQRLLHEVGQRDEVDGLHAELVQLRTQLFVAREEARAARAMSKRQEHIAETVKAMQNEIRQLRSDKAKAEAAEKAALQSLTTAESDMLRAVAAARHLNTEFALCVN